MTGSGSTVVALGGADAAPSGVVGERPGDEAGLPRFLAEEEPYRSMFRARARLMTREAGKWWGE